MRNGRTKIDWTKIDPFLAELSTNEVRDRFGINASTSIWRRRVLGIPVVKGRRKKRIWELRIKWADIDKYLGVLSDMEVANKFNISTASVSTRRVKLGIALKRSPLRFSQVDWSGVIDLLGTIPDTDIAERLGVSSTTILYKRNSLGIKKYKGVLSHRKSSESFAKKTCGNCKFYDTPVGKVQGKAELAYINKLILEGRQLPEKYRKAIQTPFGHYIPDFEFPDRFIEIKSDYTFKISIGEAVWSKKSKKRQYCQMEKINYVREFVKPVQLIIIN